MNTHFSRATLFAAALMFASSTLAGAPAAADESAKHETKLNVSYGGATDGFPNELTVRWQLEKETRPNKFRKVKGLPELKGQSTAVKLPAGNYRANARLSDLCCVQVTRFLTVPEDKSVDVPLRQVPIKFVITLPDPAPKDWKLKFSMKREDGWSSSGESWEGRGDNLKSYYKFLDPGKWDANFTLNSGQAGNAKFEAKVGEFPIVEIAIK